MKFFLLLPLLLLPPVATAPVTVLAPVPASDGLRRERLPADVDLVVHFDLETFKATELWRRISASAEGAELRTELGELQEIEARFGIDPFTDVRAVTLFKVKSEEEPTVVLFSTSERIDGALKRFQEERGYARVLEGDIELHTWREDGDDDEGEEEHETVFAYLHAGPGTERVVALSATRASALRTARVLRGEDVSHAKAGTLLNLAPARGSFLYVAAAEIPHLDDIPPASQFFGLAQGLQLDLGEAGGLLSGHMGLSAASNQDAYDLSGVINGVVSLARLAGREAGEALELLSGLRVGTRANVVTLDFEYDVARLFEILEAVGGLEERIRDRR